MRLIAGKWLLICLCACLPVVGVCLDDQALPHPALSALPGKMLWAWERPEDLRDVPPDIGVAWVAMRILLMGDHVNMVYRRQPLQMSAHTVGIAVVHVDASTRRPPVLNDVQKQAIVDALVQTAAVSSVPVVQLDFEVRRSQRAFLQSVVQAARASLPQQVALSMTALASWCEGDRWLSDVPADEIVPMAFRMASDDRLIRQRLVQNRQFSDPRCRLAMGIATDEPPVPLQTGRIYYFSPVSWHRGNVPNRAIVQAR
ncbi:hypothetical protein KSF73_12495 [Burkholderiaceae bacterium DAT-1]|nr:hypothetical protein [Burkholderiaceae bacterium DAT-1]